VHPLNANLLLAIPLLPLIAAVVAGLGGRLIGRAGVHTIACLAVGVSCLLSLLVLKQVYFDGAPLYDRPVYTWLVTASRR
jgi:NADH-quinone oxidoreductase subunit L